tara:strand:- start:379 stop:696 length:318 start_codon:yes stop_codon:yes gene_type:complete
MKSNIYLIILLLSIILLCSCLSKLNNTRIIEKYNTNSANYLLHNDAVQNMTINNINEKIESNNNKIKEITSNSNVISKNIKDIEKQNALLQERLQQLIAIAENNA